MQIKTYSILYLLGNLTTIYFLSFDSYSFNYSPNTCDLQAHNSPGLLNEILNDLQSHELLHKLSDVSSIVLSETPYETLSKVPSTTSLGTSSDAPTKVPTDSLSNEHKQISLVDNIYYLFFKLIILFILILFYFLK